MDTNCNGIFKIDWNLNEARIVTKKNTKNWKRTIMICSDLFLGRVENLKGMIERVKNWKQVEYFRRKRQKICRKYMKNEKNATFFPCIYSSGFSFWPKISETSKNCHRLHADCMKLQQCWCIASPFVRELEKRRSK